MPTCRPTNFCFLHVVGKGIGLHALKPDAKRRRTKEEIKADRQKQEEDQALAALARKEQFQWADYSKAMMKAGEETQHLKGQLASANQMATELINEGICGMTPEGDVRIQPDVLQEFKAYLTSHRPRQPDPSAHQSQARTPDKEHEMSDDDK